MATLFESLEKFGWYRDDIADVVFTIDGDICFSFSNPDEPEYALALGIALYWAESKGDAECRLWLDLSHFVDGSIKNWGIDCPIDLTEINIILHNHEGNKQWQQD